MKLLIFDHAHYHQALANTFAKGIVKLLRKSLLDIMIGSHAQLLQYIAERESARIKLGAVGQFAFVK